MNIAIPTVHDLEHRHAIGRLCVEGDRAFAHGDFAALRDIAQRLAELLEEPLHCELVALADTGNDIDEATATWSHLKERVYRDARS